MTTLLDDFRSKLALAGLEHVSRSSIDIMTIADKYGGYCDKQIHIDYAVIDYPRLISFCGLVNSKYIRYVQDAVSFCVIAAYAANVGEVKCAETRSKPPIYS
jgi:hypothetical protein